MDGAVAGGVVVDGAYRLTGPGFAADGSWWRGAHLREEAARGLAADEDLWSIGTFTPTSRRGRALEITAWVGDLATGPHRPGDYRDRDRPSPVTACTPPRYGATSTRPSPWPADAFVIAGPDIVAGYPWFGAWSRDTLTSYEGLILTASRADEGRELLRRYASAVSDGMLPNTADTSTPGAIDFHSVDAPLWFIHAVGRHVAIDRRHRSRTGACGPCCRSIIDAYAAGTRFGIGTDPRGLITAGTPDTSLTWMDARVDGKPVTSRWGSAVEINALWINALGVMNALGADLGGRRDAAITAFDLGIRPIRWIVAGRGRQRRHRTRRSGRTSCSPTPCRTGRCTAAGRRCRRRASADAARAAHARARRPGYRGQHLGDGRTRDLAYHQGTVWPWMIGPYVARPPRRRPARSTGCSTG